MKSNSTIKDKLKKTSKHTLIFGLAGALQQAIVLILIPIYTSNMLVEEYGKLGLVRQTISILTALFSLSIVSGMFRSYFDYDKKEDRQMVISTSFFMLLGCSVIYFLFGILFYKFISIKVIGVESHLFFIAILFGIFGMLNTIPLAIFRARNKSFQFVIIQTIGLIITIAISIYLVKFKSLGIKGALLSQLLGSIVLFLILYVNIFKEIHFIISLNEIKKILFFSFPLVPGNIAAFFLNYSDRYFLKIYNFENELGLYNLGYQIGMVVMILFMQPLKMAWQPIFLEHKDDQNAKPFFSKTSTYVVLLGSIFFLVLSLFSREVIILLSNKSYWEAHQVVPPIILSYVVFSLVPFVTIGHKIKRNTIMLSLNIIFGGCINLILNYFLIPQHGMMGAAYSTLIAYFLMLFFAYFTGQKIYKLKYEYKRIFKITILTCILFFIGNELKLESIIISITCKAILIVFYPIVLYMFGFFETKEKYEIKKIIYKLKKIIPL